MAQDVRPAGSFPVSAIDPFSHAYIRDPYPFHRELRDAGPVVWLDRYGLFMAPRYAEAHAIVSDPATFCSSAGVGMSNLKTEGHWRPPSLLLEADPPEHTRRRAALNKVISAPNLRRYRADFEKIAASVVERALDLRDVEVTSQIAEPYVLAAFPGAVGLTAVDRNHLVKYGSMVFNGFGPDNELRRAAMADAEPTVAWIMQQCQRENLQPGKLGDQVYQLVETGEVTAEEAPILVRSFLSAGVDTTLDAVGNALFCFAKHPHEWAKIKANSAKAKSAFEEILRYEPPFQTFFRTTTRDVEIGGVTIPRDAKILLSLGSANRDPRKWDRADVFDIDRVAVGHVGFGYGIHNCIGQMIARLEIEVLLAELARRNVDIALAGEPRIRLHNTLRGYEHLPIRLTAP